MMETEEGMVVTILILKLQCCGLIYVFRLMHAYVKGTITITRAGDDAATRQADERERSVIFKNCVPFT